MKKKQVMAILHSHFGVPSNKEAAFLGRVQHLQKMGFPEKVNTGKGKPAEYTEQRVFELCAAMHLTLMGVAPEKTAEIIKANRAALMKSVETRAPCSIYVVGEYQTASPAEIRFDAYKVADALAKMETVEKV